MPHRASSTFPRRIAHGKARTTRLHMAQIMTLKSPQEIDTMAELRGQIDALDQELVRLLALRQSHIDRAAQIKPAIGLPARIDDRVEEVVSHVRELSKTEGFDPEIAAQMWRFMVDGMIAREERAMAQTPKD